MSPAFIVISPNHLSSEGIRIAMEQLKDTRPIDPAHRAELRWEIRLYEFILAQPNPDEAATKYHQMRHSLPGSTLLTKREVANKLGWKIP